MHDFVGHDLTFTHLSQRNRNHLGTALIWLQHLPLEKRNDIAADNSRMCPCLDCLLLLGIIHYVADGEDVWMVDQL